MQIRLTDDATCLLTGIVIPAGHYIQGAADLGTTFYGMWSGIMVEIPVEYGAIVVEVSDG